MFEDRFYRDYMLIERFSKFTVIEQESDLQFIAKSNLEREARDLIIKYRNQIADYIKLDPLFLTSLAPIKVHASAPQIVKHMAEAAFKAEVGPMASVAGAISQYVSKDLLTLSDEILAENGGDIYMNFKTSRKVLVYAGSSPFSCKLALNISKELMPVGICTSAGTVGHSLSFGKADAVVVICKDTLIADAAATAIGNIVKTSEDINAGITLAKEIKEILGILIIVGDKMGAWGEINLCAP